MNYFISQDGITKNHWFHSTVAFTAIMHIISYKIFIELKYWNKLSIFITIFSLIFYYSCVLVLNTTVFAASLNNELTHIFFDVLTYFKSWIIIICLPLVSLMPDLFINWVRYNFFSSPSDVIFANQQIFREMNREDKNVLPNTARSPKNENNVVNVVKTPKNIHDVEAENFKGSPSERKLHDNSESKHYLQSMNVSNVNEVNAHNDDSRNYKLSLGNNNNFGNEKENNIAKM